MFSKGGFTEFQATKNMAFLPKTQNLLMLNNLTTGYVIY